MFGIGFWEIVLIGVVALVVVGPEKFPGMVKTAGFWLGRFREMTSSVKQEFKNEIDRAEHLRKLIEEQQEILQRHQITDETKAVVGASVTTATVAPVVSEVAAAPSPSPSLAAPASRAVPAAAPLPPLIKPPPIISTALPAPTPGQD